jgi:hypothetical protein
VQLIAPQPSISAAHPSTATHTALSAMQIARAPWFGRSRNTATTRTAPEAAIALLKTHWEAEAPDFAARHPRKVWRVRIEITGVSEGAAGSGERPRRRDKYDRW